MDVSINYPWGTHMYRATQATRQIKIGDPIYQESPGWDFGGPPAGYGIPVSLRGGGLGPFWMRHIREDLLLFHRIGLKAVRFAILFNGLMYGVDSDIPTETNNPNERWRFRPVRLSNRFVEDFRQLVREFGAFSDRGVPRLKLMPVLFGFEFVQDIYEENRVQREDCERRRANHERCLMPDRLNPNPERPGENLYADFYAPPNPPGRVRYCAGRRGMALSRTHSDTHSDGRRLTYGEIFLIEVLKRLLDEFLPGHPLANYHNVIHSWDLCGEPEGFTSPPRVTTPVWPRVVTNADMLLYLTEGINLVHKYNFEATVGFRHMNTVADWHWTTLPPHLRQFHTYDGEQLPRVRPNETALIGEAATAEDSPFDSQFRYRGATHSRRVMLQDRLEWFEDRGYREVFLWSGGRARPNNRHSWSRHEQDQIERFTGGLRSTRAQRNVRFVRVP